MQKKISKYNVLMISPYGKDLANKKGEVFSGGQQRQIDYAGFLNKYQIIVPAVNENELDVVELASNLNVFPVKAKNRLSFFVNAFKKALKLIKEENINVISCDNPYDSAVLGVILKFLFRLPLLIHSMAEMIDNPYYIGENKNNKYKNFLAKITTNFADYIRVSTNTETLRMRERGFKKDKLLKASFYIDFNKFEGKKRNEELRKKVLDNKYDRIVLFLGRIAKQKDLDTTIRAIPSVVRDYPKTLFAIIGDGPKFDYIKKLVKDVGVEENVWMPGSVKYDEVVDYYKISDIFVATSIYEGTCMTLHEAAICKLPIISTDFAGAVDLIEDDENGYLVKIGDYMTVADRIKDLLSSNEKIEIMGVNNYEIVKNDFSKEKALKEYEKMFEIIFNNN